MPESQKVVDMRSLYEIQPPDNFPTVENDNTASNVYSELFRAKIYQHYILLEASGVGGLEGGLVENATASPTDFEDEGKLKSVMREKPFAIVQSDPFPEEKQELLFQTYGDVRVRSRRRLRARISRVPALDIFSRWLVENKSFQFFILIVIGYNSITLGFQAEYGDRTGAQAATVRIILDCLDILALTIFMFEIFLKFMVNFRNFWDNSWNVFDLLITAFTFVTTVIQLIGSADNNNSSLESVAQTMKAFQVLRLLRILTRSQGMKVIVFTVTQSLKDMGSILVLFALFLYIFLVTGVIFWAGMSTTTDYLTPQNSTDEMRHYGHRFKNLYEGFLTLYQIFTIDHWYAMLHNSWYPITGDWSLILYMFLWLLIGSLIFRNIFASVVVNTFQSLRETVGNEEEDENKELSAENFTELKKFIDQQIADEAEKMTLGENLLIEARDSMSNLKEGGGQTNSDCLLKINRDNMEWLCSYTKSIQMINKLVNMKSTKWSKELLFSYFQIMEELQDSLYERQEILKMMDDWIMAMLNRDDPKLQPTASDRTKQLKQMLNSQNNPTVSF